MCLAPITIPNPHYGHTSVGFSYLHNTQDSHIEVPCGHCVQCVSMRQGFFNQRIQMESLRSDLFFFTLTYNNESLIYVNEGEYNLPIMYYPDIANFFKRIRRSGYSIRYTYVSEYGTRRHRPHLHGILAVERQYNPSISPHMYRTVELQFKNLFALEWRRNYGTSLDPYYEPLSTPVFKRGRNTTFDFHYIEPVLDHDNDVSFYVSKYITKYDSRTHKLLQKISLDPSLSDDQTSFLLSMVKPRCVMSKDFGDYDYPSIRQYIRKCINNLSTPLPQFYDLNTGQSCLLAPYYRNHLYTLQDAHLRMALHSDHYEDGYMLIDDDSSILEFSQSRESNLEKMLMFGKNLKKMQEKFGD